jgi:glycosyltransferase involved in cell wall biosynthesis
VRLVVPNALRIGVVSEGDPTDLRIRSGPAGVTRGFGEFAQQVTPISVLPSGNAFRAAMLLGILPHVRHHDLRSPRTGLQRLWAPGLSSPPVRLVGRRATQRRLAAAGHLDGLVQFGVTDVVAPPGLPMVTVQDSTLRQALLAYPWSYLEGMRPAEAERRVRRAQNVYTSAVACCAATHWAADSLISDYGVARERVHVVGLAPNFEAPNRVPERDWRVPRFLFAGVDWRRKNGAAVLAAFRRLREDHPDATLDIVSEHEPVSAEGVVPHGRLRLENVDERRRLQALFTTATAFVMPSLHEPAGIAYLDAAVVGLPSIATTNGGAVTMVGDGGILVDPHSPQALLDAMRRLTDPDRAAALGERARQHAERFTWRQVAERILRALRIPGVDHSDLAEFL